MKKQGYFLAATLLLSVILTACSGGAAPASAVSGSAMPADIIVSSEASNGTLVLALEATFPPYEYMSGTEVVGIDVDIAREIAKELNMELDVQEMPFDSVIAAVNTGKADMAASGLSVTEERQEQVDFSVEYATSKQVIMTRDDSGITAPSNLAGTVGVQMGTTGDIELSDTEAYPGLQIDRYNKYTDAVNDLISGRLDAIVMDSLPAESLKTMADNLVILEESLLDDSYAIAVQKGNDELRDSINAVLERLIADGSIDQFTLNHLGGGDAASSMATSGAASGSVAASSMVSSTVASMASSAA